MKLVIPGNPISWKRAGRNGKISYDKQLQEKMKVKWIVRTQLKAICAAPTPFKLEFQFYVLPKKDRAEGSLKIDLTKKHRIVDIDNYIKFYFDALNGLCWDDDSWIYEVHAYKIYSMNPRTIINMLEFTDEEIILSFEEENNCEKIEQDLRNIYT